MGIHFGNLQRVRHIITFRLSPFEQKAFVNFFYNTGANFWRQVTKHAFRMGPPFLGAYLVYRWGSEEYERNLRKNPADYENDE